MSIGARSKAKLTALARRRLPASKPSRQQAELTANQQTMAEQRFSLELNQEEKGLLSQAASARANEFLRSLVVTAAEPELQAKWRRNVGILRALATRIATLRPT